MRWFVVLFLASAALGCTPSERQQAYDIANRVCVAVESYSPDAGLQLRIHVPESYAIRVTDGGVP